MKSEIEHFFSRSKKDIEAIERVKRQSTKLVPNVGDLPYTDQL